MLAKLSIALGVLLVAAELAPPLLAQLSTWAMDLGAWLIAVVRAPT